MNAVGFDFTGAAVLVTGGTSGIGHAVAHAFAEAGATVAVTGTRPSAEAYDADLSPFAYHPLQAEDGASIDAVAAAMSELDVLVNNAGATMPGGGDERDPDVFARSLAVNLTAAMRLTTACRPALAASPLPGGASVVQLVSMSAFRAVPLVPGYGAAKAGLVQLTRNLAQDWVADGIRVNAVAPGLVDTPMTAPMHAFPELLAAELAHVPVGRMARPEEISPAVLFLSSAAAAYITGSVLAVDGGYLTV